MMDIIILNLEHSAGWLNHATHLFPLIQNYIERFEIKHSSF